MLTFIFLNDNKCWTIFGFPFSTAIIKAVLFNKDWNFIETMISKYHKKLINNCIEKYNY